MMAKSDKMGIFRFQNLRRLCFGFDVGIFMEQPTMPPEMPQVRPPIKVFRPESLVIHIPKPSHA